MEFSSDTKSLQNSIFIQVTAFIHSLIISMSFIQVRDASPGNTGPELGVHLWAPFTHTSSHNYGQYKVASTDLLYSSMIYLFYIRYTTF